MIALEGNRGVWIRSDEAHIIDHLRDSERLRQRRAKIEEIRARMRAMREREETEGWETVENQNDAKGDEKEQKDENQGNGLLRMAGDVASAVGNGCKNASGVFRQINKKGKPIFEHIAGGKMGMRQINMKGKKAIFKPSKGVTNSVANGVGKACLVAAVAMDAYEIGTAIKQDYEGGTMHNTVHTSSGVAGSWAGAVPGALYGASLGSVVPVAGSLVGGILGGVIGSLGGAFLARKAAETVMPAPVEKKEEDEEEREEEVPGQCVLCRLSLASFDLFYQHFVENHPDELMRLFAAVVERAGEQRMDIEDPWFVSKAFVCREDEIEQWGMDDILAFNDRILLALGWNEEECGEEEGEEKGDGWTREEEVYEEEKEEEVEEIQQKSVLIEAHQLPGGLLSVL